MTLRKKRPFTLLEAMISVSILAMILSFLFSTLRSLATLTTKIDKARGICFSRLHLKQRLSTAFSRIEPCVSLATLHGVRPFYTEQVENIFSLCFFFDGGVDPEEAFTGALQGKLTYEDHTLYLDTTSLQEPSSTRREILCRDISSMHMEFYKQRSLQNDPTNSTQMEILDHWSTEEEILPHYVYLSLTHTDGSIAQYCFAISSFIQPIHYEI